MKVVALTNFNAGKLQLVGLTQNITLLSMTVPIPDTSTTIDLGVAFEVEGKPVHILAKPSLSFPKEKTGTSDASEGFLVSYWAVKQVFDTRLVNVEKETKTVAIKVGNESLSIDVPIFTNSSNITAGDELAVLKVAPADESDDGEPAPKRARKGKGKGTGKGKSKK